MAVDKNNIVDALKTKVFGSTKPEITRALTLRSSKVPDGSIASNQRANANDLAPIGQEPEEILYTHSPRSELSGLIVATVLCSISVLLILYSALTGKHAPSIGQLVTFAIYSSFLGTLCYLNYCALYKFCKIRLDSQGVEFSPGWLWGWSFELLMRTNRSWEDLKAVDFVNLSKNKDLQTLSWRDQPDRRPLMPRMLDVPGPQLFLDFSSGGSASITLRKLTKRQANQLFQALEKWSQSAKLSSKATQLKEALLCDAGESNFTELWNKDLELRHGSTNFVPLLPGTYLQNDRLKVVVELATGGFSAVYLVEDKLGVKFCLKEAVLPYDMNDQVREKCRQAFRREAGLLMKIAHPQIVEVFDYFVENGRDYLLLEYIPGKSLRQVVIMNGPFSESKVIGIAIQIAEIVAYLHALEPPVVHRDLTPDNLVLKQNGQVILVDFGAANEFVGTATSTMVGKQSYISPEQFRGKSEPRSDVYALGCTMFFLLTGKDPIALSCSAPADFASVSNRLNAIVERCTRLERDDRFSADVLLSVLRALAHEQPECQLGEAKHNG